MRKCPAIAILVLAVTLVTANRSPAQDVAELVSPTARIPANYVSWSLFLVCNPTWLTMEKSRDLYNLYQQFKGFGRTIGDSHVAVWFWKSGMRRDSPLLAENVDVERSVRFCKAYGLKPSSSPYIVVTTTYPDEEFKAGETSLRGSGNIAIFELANMKPAEITQLLGKLTDELVVKGRVEYEQGSPQVVTSFWIRFLEAAQQTMSSFGCAWNLKIETGLLTADLRPCQKH